MTTAVVARRGGRPRTAVALALVTYLLTLTGVLLLVAAREPATPELLFTAVDVMVGLVYGTVGAVIVARRSHVVGWLVVGTGVGGALATLGSGWGAYHAAHPSLPPLPLVASFVSWAWVPGTLGLFLVVPWLVRETRPSWWARAGLALGVATTAVFTLQRLLLPGTDNTGTVVATVVVGAVTAAATGWRRVRGPVAERPGLGLLAAGVALMALSFLPLAFADTPFEIVLAVPLLHLACQALFPVALLTTVLRNRLWGIDLAVSRAAVAALLTVGLAVVYAVVLMGVGALVDSSPVAQVLAAAGVAAAVQPVHGWLGRRVRVLVYGEAATPGRAALRVGRQLSVASDADDLLRGLAGALGEALRLESVTVRGTRPDAEATWGVATSAPVERPLEHGGRRVGSLALTARPGERLDARSTDALDHLAPVVAAGVALAQGTADLVRARDAATRARLAERTLIRRELHDGIGPWLTGLRLGLQGARNTLDRDPAAAAAVLDALQAEVTQRVEDVRLLSRSLLPPVLDEQGLAAALDDLARRTAANGFTVTLDVDADALDGLDPRVAAAAYGIVSEAVTNASRHSGAATCTVTAAVHGATVVVTCDDDGHGMPPDRTSGVGTRSMRERATELGGSVAWVDRDGGGVRVRAVLPLVPDASDASDVGAEGVLA
ncbi:sensor histidine kinase [Cellulomonas fimi]|uniref:sensor histidine kinase n=1 Tax=Cellulomonas fimi TaxID=1708 RepID=UPI002358944C|nr:histidine kinase [Cellulomonas fimi]